jgi:hypothetical protein
MEDAPRSVYWEAPEHTHIEKSSDWYWILGIVAVAGSVASIILGNVLFGIVILLGATVMMLYSRHEPRIIAFEVSGRGVRVENDLYPYSTLESFFLDEDNPNGPQLIVKPTKLLSQLLIIPVPEEYLDVIESILAPRLPEEHLEEPFSHQLLEFFGF